MATHIGNEGSVAVGANAVAQAKRWSLTTEAQTVDDTVLGDTWDSHLTGTKSWQASVDALLDETDTNGQGVLIEGASVTLNLYLEGTDSGDTYYSGTGTVTSLTRNVALNEATGVTMQVKGNGALTVDTVV